MACPGEPAGNADAPPGPELLQEPDGGGVAIFFAVARFDCGDNHEDDPENKNDRQDKETDEDEAEGTGDGGVNCVADLEVDHFLAGAVEKGGCQRA